jgi:hypothetical protein
MNGIQEHVRAHHCRVILAQVGPAGPAQGYPALGRRSTVWAPPVME